MLSMCWLLDCCAVCARLTDCGAAWQGAEADEDVEVYEAYRPARLREGVPHPGMPDTLQHHTSLHCPLLTPCFACIDLLS